MHRVNAVGVLGVVFGASDAELNRMTDRECQEEVDRADPHEGPSRQRGAGASGAHRESKGPNQTGQARIILITRHPHLHDL